MAKIEEHLRSQDEKLTDIKQQLGDFICSCEIKFAGKRETETRLDTLEKDRIGKLEKIVYGAIGLILVSFVGALIGLVFIK